MKQQWHDSNGKRWLWVLPALGLFFQGCIEQPPTPTVTPDPIHTTCDPDGTPCTTPPSVTPTATSPSDTPSATPTSVTPTQPPTPTPTPCTGVFYLDSDGDGYGDDAISEAGCTAPEGYASAAGDCEDGEALINPGAQEVCDPDQTDENCNGVSDDLDDGVDPSGQLTFYVDSDRDGYGSSTVSVDACIQPDGYSESNDDCNDGNIATHPNAPELCDGLDNDCDQNVDDTCWDIAQWDGGKWGE